MASLNQPTTSRGLNQAKKGDLLAEISEVGSKMLIQTGLKTPEVELNEAITQATVTNETMNVHEKSWTNVVKGANNSRRLLREDKVEAMDESEKKSSIWDNFDIGKISNAGFKLDYTSPNKQSESTVCEIEIEDISSEINY